MKTSMFKSALVVSSIFVLSGCSSEPDPKLEAQKRLEAEAKEIKAKTMARIEFREKNCKDITEAECLKLMQEAGVGRKGREFKLN